MRSDIEENLVFENILIFLQKTTYTHTHIYISWNIFICYKDSNMRRGAQKCRRKSASTIWYALKNLGAL